MLEATKSKPPSAARDSKRRKSKGLKITRRPESKISTSSAMVRLTKTVARLQTYLEPESSERDRAVRESNRFCMDCRKAWGLLWSRWVALSAESRTRLLDQFIEQVTRGLRLLDDVTPSNPGEAQQLAEYTENCGLRRVFARTLKDDGPDKTEEAIAKAILSSTRR